MTRNAIALEMGGLVFRTASLNGNDRESAAENIVCDNFPKLSERNRTFLVWALLNAESHYVRTERPALPAEGQRSDDAHSRSVPAGDSDTGDGQNLDDDQCHLAAPDYDDGGDGGHLCVDTHTRPAPVSRRRLALDRSSPADYPIYVPNVGRVRLGDLTREYAGYIHHDRKVRRKHAEQKETGWKRIRDFLPDGGVKLEDRMDDLSTTDRRFLAEEVGIEEWREAA